VQSDEPSRRTPAAQFEPEPSPRPPVRHTWPALGLGLRGGLGALDLPDNQLGSAGGLAVRPGVHLTPLWSTWLDLRAAAAVPEGDTMGNLEASASLRATIEFLGVEAGLGVAHLWRDLDDGNDVVRLSATGIAIPVRLVGGWNLANPSPGATFGVDVSFQRYETGGATWMLAHGGVEW
jgi:hypothetical protein